MTFRRFLLTRVVIEALVGIPLAWWLVSNDLPWSALRSLAERLAVQ